MRAELDRTRSALRDARDEARRAEVLAAQYEREQSRRLGELERRIDELHASRQESQAAADTKARLLATMSHELRTPLNGMVGSAELLLGSELDSEQRQLVELLQRSSNALLSIVNDLLDYSRLEADRMPLERTPFRLEPCVEDVIELQRTVADEKGLELRATWHAGVPSVVLGDAGRLRQVLMNLVTNALKFTAHGRVEIEIQSAGSGLLEFAVRDTGIGIQPTDQLELFDEFRQATATTVRDYGGSGLGLAVCKRLVALMGGTIAVESTFGEGSTFTFTAELPSAEGAAPTPTSSPETRSSRPGNRGRVLIVDDNRSNRYVLARMLARLGFECDEAIDGVDAAARVSGQDYRVVFMDCDMPVMNGMDATQVIRSLPEPRCSVPIVALTAYSLPADKERCEAVGMDAYLGKPVALAELAATLAELVPEPAVDPAD